MRRDFVLPVLLFLALMVMAFYATTTGHHGSGAELVSTPVLCKVSAPVERLAESVRDHRPVKLELVATLTDSGPGKSVRVTDAAVSPDGRWIALRTNDLVLFYRTSALLSGSPGTPLSFDLRALKEPQGEGIAWADGQTLYLAGEAEGGGTFARITCALPN